MCCVQYLVAGGTAYMYVLCTILTLLEGLPIMCCVQYLVAGGTAYVLCTILTCSCWRDCLYVLCTILRCWRDCLHVVYNT